MAVIRWRRSAPGEGEQCPLGVGEAGDLWKESGTVTSGEAQRGRGLGRPQQWSHLGTMSAPTPARNVRPCLLIFPGGGVFPASTGERQGRRCPSYRAQVPTREKGPAPRPQLRG